METFGGHEDDVEAEEERVSKAPAWRSRMNEDELGKSKLELIRDDWGELVALEERVWNKRLGKYVHSCFIDVKESE